MNPIRTSLQPSPVALEPTSPRVTPREGASFRQVLAQSATKFVQSAELAIHKLPGGPAVAAAVRPGLSPAQSPHMSGSSLQTAAAAAEGPGASAAAGAAGASGASPSIEGALATSQDMNLYYLQMQEALAAENRAYTACSNVLKARHDTVKNAIGNIR